MYEYEYAFLGFFVKDIKGWRRMYGIYIADLSFSLCVFCTLSLVVCVPLSVVSSLSLFS